MQAITIVNPYERQPPIPTTQEKKKMSNVQEINQKVQEQTLDVVKKTQDATVDAVTSLTETANKVTTSLPDFAKGYEIPGLGEITSSSLRPPRSSIPTSTSSSSSSPASASSPTASSRPPSGLPNNPRPRRHRRGRRTYLVCRPLVVPVASVDATGGSQSPLCHNGLRCLSARVERGVSSAASRRTGRALPAQLRRR